MTRLPQAEDIELAAERIDAAVHRTPVLTSTRLDDLTGARLFFKAEHLQRTGSFKLRGASNAVLSLDDDDAGSGVATHSSGNHGAALACAAQARGIDCHVVVPRGAVRCKLDNMRRYGAHLVECDPTQAGREAGLAQVLDDSGATAIPPYDHPHIIAGQGTAARELLQQAGPLDALIAPLGGGGLLSGSALWCRHLGGTTLVYGAEPAGADDTARSLAAGRIVDDHKPDTICDGLRALVGHTTFTLIRDHVHQVITVTDQQVIDAMRLLWEVTKQVVEPSSATVLAAILANPQPFRGRRVGLILSGGNVDLDALPWT